MPKPNPLSQGLKTSETARSKAATPRRGKASADAAKAEVTAARVTPGNPGRAGRVLIGGHFAPEVSVMLKVIAAEERTTIQALLADALNTIFAKHGKPEIA
jgi:hypothetical protein